MQRLHKQRKQCEFGFFFLFKFELYFVSRADEDDSITEQLMHQLFGNSIRQSFPESTCQVYHFWNLINFTLGYRSIYFYVRCTILLFLD